MLYLHNTDLKFDWDLVFFLVWVRIFEKCKYLSFLNFERRLKNLSKKSDIFVLTWPNDSSERFLLPVKLSSVCLSTFKFIGHLSHPGDLLPPVCIRHRQSSVIRIVVRRSLTTSSQKLLCQYNIHHWYIASVGRET